MPEFAQRQNRTQSSQLVSTAKPDRVISNPARADNPLVALQETLGNQAMQRLLHAGVIQTKLKIGQPGDVYEREADRVAEQVMRMPEPGIQQGTIPVGETQDARIQRCQNGQLCGPCARGECSHHNQGDKAKELLQRQPLEEEEDIEEILKELEEEEEPEELLQTKEAPGRTPELPPGAESRIQGLRGGGHRLPVSVRAYFEPRFGYDFSQVRVHTDRHAHASAGAVGARAFTVGKNIVFGAGKYAPTAEAGRRLLAHELTHVVQQSAAPALAEPTKAQEPSARPTTAAHETIAGIACAPQISRTTERVVQRQDAQTEEAPSPASILRDCRLFYWKNAFWCLNTYMHRFPPRPLKYYRCIKDAKWCLEVCKKPGPNYGKDLCKFWEI